MIDLTYKTARKARLALQSFFLDSTGEYACRDWTLADWSNAMCGEAGEAANIVKKIRRGDIDSELIRKLGDELADLSAYIDLLAFHAGIDLDAAIERKYNQLSERLGSETRIVNGALNPADRPLESFMILKANGQIYVKTKRLFIEQRGDRDTWGNVWTEIQAASIEDARIKGSML